jgi:hypothetical protein
MNFLDPRPYVEGGDVGMFEGFVHNLTPQLFVILAVGFLTIAIVEIVDRIRGGDGIFF